MKRFLSVWLLIWAVITLCACNNIKDSTLDSSPSENKQHESYTETTDAIKTEVTSDTENDKMKDIEIIANGKAFSAKLYENETSEAILKKLPMTVEMSELNGNEKYFYLPDSLPIDSNVPTEIHTGDIMLYGSDCLVLFYKSFLTSYSYTPVGYIENADELAQTIGNGNVTVTFKSQ